LWPCKNCGHDNPDEAIVCENCGALMDEIGDSGDNKDSEDLFFDDEGILKLLELLSFMALFSGSKKHFFVGS